VVLSVDGSVSSTDVDSNGFKPADSFLFFDGSASSTDVDSNGFTPADSFLL